MPEAAIAARQIGCANALRRILGDLEGVGGLEAHVLFALAMDMPRSSDESTTFRHRNSAR